MFLKAPDIHYYTDFQKGCYQITFAGKGEKDLLELQDLLEKYLTAILFLKNNNAFYFEHVEENLLCVVIY